MHFNGTKPVSSCSHCARTLRSKRNSRSGAAGRSHMDVKTTCACAIACCCMVLLRVSERTSSIPTPCGDTGARNAGFSEILSSRLRSIFANGHPMVVLEYLHKFFTYPHIAYKILQNCERLGIWHLNEFEGLHVFPAVFGLQSCGPGRFMPMPGFLKSKVDNASAKARLRIFPISPPTPPMN